MKKIFYKLILVFALFGCEDMTTIVDLELPEHQSLLVINSVPEIEDYVRVYISSSLDPLSNSQYQYLNDAIVLLKHDNIIDSAEFIEATLEEPCFYNVPKLIEGEAYTLEAHHVNYPSAYSTITVPYGVPVLDISIDSIYDNRIPVAFSIIDPIQVNYYYLRFTVKKDGKWQTSSFETYDPSFDDRGIVEDGQINGRKIFFTDQLFNNLQKTFEFELIIKDGIDDVDGLGSDFIAASVDSIKIHFFTTNESYYKYHISRKLQDRNENNPLTELLGAEPVVVYNNIENGFGVFGVRVKNDTIIAVDY